MKNYLEKFNKFKKIAYDYLKVNYPNIRKISFSIRNERIVWSSYLKNGLLYIEVIKEIEQYRVREFLGFNLNKLISYQIINKIYGGKGKLYMRSDCGIEVSCYDDKELMKHDFLVWLIRRGYTSSKCISID